MTFEDLFDLASMKNNNNNNKLDLDTIKSVTAAPFTGVYKHYDKTNILIIETKEQ